MTNNNQQTDNKNLDLLDFIDVIAENKYLIAGITAISLSVAAIYSTLTTPIYQSNALIQVEQNSGGSGSAAFGDIANLFDTQPQIISEMEILRSRLVIGKTVEDLNLSIHAEPKYIPVIGKWLANRSNSPSTILPFGYSYGNEKIIINEIEIPNTLENKNLILKKINGKYELFDNENKLIANGDENLNFTSTIPGVKIEIKEITGNDGTEFIINKQSHLKSTTNLQQEITISEKAKQSNIINLSIEGSDPKKISTIINKIAEKYVEQNIQRKSAEAEKTLEFVNEFLPLIKSQMEIAEEKYTEFRQKNSTFDLSVESKAALESIIELRVKLLELQQKHKELNIQFTPAHPAIKTINEQIKTIQREIKKIEDGTKSTPRLEQELIALTRDSKVTGELYINLLNNAQQLKLIKEGKIGSVRIIDNAYIPEKPIKPQKLLIILASLIGGIILGSLAAVVRSKIKAGIEHPSEIEQELGLPVFSTISKSSEQEEIAKKIDQENTEKILAEVAPQDLAIESLRSLRTSLQFALLESKNNILLITGPTPGIGKSFISVNFAAVLGKSGKKILLIDSDLRRGYLNKYFNVSRSPGLSDVISEKIDLETAIHKNIIQNVDFISTGAIPPNPSEVLMSSKLPEHLNKLSNFYDLIIIDSAPVLAVSDSLALANQAGTIFSVCRSEITTLPEIQETKKRIEQAGRSISGIIFNGVSLKNRTLQRKYGFYQYTNYNYTSIE